jgi:hypothetical protein
VGADMAEETVVFALEMVHIGEETAYSVSITEPWLHQTIAFPASRSCQQLAQGARNCH